MIDMLKIKCQHPTKDQKGQIEESLDWVCIKADCTHPYRYACDYCQQQHKHNDGFIRLDKFPKNLENLRQQIEYESQNSNNNATSIMAKQEKLTQIINDLIDKMKDKLLQWTSEKFRNNHYVQLLNILISNEIKDSKKQVQRLGEILSKTAILNENYQIEIIKTPPDFQLDLIPLRDSLEKCVDDFFQYLDSQLIIQIQEINKPPKKQEPIFKFDKNMTYNSQTVTDNKVIANAGARQVTLISPNLSKLQSSLLSIKVDIHGGMLEGDNQNRMGLYFGSVEKFNFKYVDDNSSQFILVGDNKKKYIGQTESDCNFCLVDGINRLKIEYDKLQKKLNIHNEKNSNSISFDVPNHNDCYFCFILNMDATVEIL